ncbi:MAG: MAPEG family protein [Nevskiaceae bacterium]
MSEVLLAYQSTLAACTVLAGLIMVQVLVADTAGMKVRHVPGMPVADGHASFHFRAVRALGNTNETLGLFLLLVALAVVFGANAKWVNVLAWVYVAARAGHMGFYYLRQGMARSTAFGIGLAAQFGLLVLVLAAAF